MALFVATPLAIVPIVSWLAASLVAPEQIALAVFAFASLGHHLPGLLRAYGDRELFARYKWRFLISPPLVLAVNLLFFVWLDLHGLELILLLWASWHLMMQTYGFMRIYDVKLGRSDPGNARRDLWACIAVFAVGIVFSEARVFGMVELAWLTGVPTFGPEWLTATRWLVGGAAVVVVAWYIRGMLAGGKVAADVNWKKLLLLACTGYLYWTTGMLTVNLLVGVAMFEIFHAIQYGAIVWTYNRRLAERGGHWLKPLAYVFRWRIVGLVIYVAAIAAYGSLGFLLRGENPLLAAKLAMALFSASAMLHFYYDGFIWKVRQPATQANLNIAPAPQPQPPPPWLSSGWAHAAKWSALATVALALLLLERVHRTGKQSELFLVHLTALTPDVPELQTRLSQEALLRGDLRAARDAARRAVDLRPRSFTAHQVHGSALSELDRWDAAERSFATAAALRPTSAAVQRAWGAMYTRRGDDGGAIHHYDAALRLSPHMFDVRRALVTTLSRAGRHTEAVETARGGLALAPQSAEAFYSLGVALSAARHFAEAEPEFVQATQRRPTWADAHFQLGLARVQIESYEAARAALERCLDLTPNHAQAHFQLGNVEYLTGHLAAAVDRYQRCTELAPEFPDAYNSLGSALMELKRWATAARAFRQSLALRPDDARSHYNLGLVFLFQGMEDKARHHVRRAAELGLAPSREVAAHLGLSPMQ